MDKMFENAKSYNEDDSQIYKDAVALQVGIPSGLGYLLPEHLVIRD